MRVKHQVSMYSHPSKKRVKTKCCHTLSTVQAPASHVCLERAARGPDLEHSITGKIQARPCHSSHSCTAYTGLLSAQKAESRLQTNRNQPLHPETYQTAARC